MKRLGSVLRLKPEAEESYKKYHAEVWPEVLETLRRCNVKNYSIFLKDGFLFSYMEYHGHDLKADFERIAADPKTQQWWVIMMPMQEPLETRQPNEWWAEMEEVFHLE